MKERKKTFELGNWLFELGWARDWCWSVTTKQGYVHTFIVSLQTTTSPSKEFVVYHVFFGPLSVSVANCMRKS